jgi:DNA-binding PadR family transcriptional regulator
VSPIFRHGRLRLYLLKLLDEAPRHGYEVIRLLQDRFMGVYSPSPGTIYPRLARLEEDGLVTHDEVDGRKVYRITEKGREEIRSRLDDLSELEDELTESVRDIAREVSEDVRDTVRSLREEITWAARDVRRSEAKAGRDGRTGREGRTGRTGSAGSTGRPGVDREDDATQNDSGARDESAVRGESAVPDGRAAQSGSAQDDRTAGESAARESAARESAAQEGAAQDRAAWDTADRDTAADRGGDRESSGPEGNGHGGRDDDDAQRIRDEARRARDEIRDTFRSQRRGGRDESRQGRGRPDWGSWADRAAGWQDWGDRKDTAGVRDSGSRGGWAGWQDWAGMPAGLDRLASDFARELNSAAGHAGDIGDGALGDLRDILSDTLARIRDEIFPGRPDADEEPGEPQDSAPDLAGQPETGASRTDGTDPADPGEN